MTSTNAIVRRAAGLLAAGVVLLAVLVSCGRTAGLAVTPELPLEWGPAPAMFPPGAEVAVLQGSPSSNAPFTIRLRVPDGYKVPPHVVTTDEHMTVVRGTLLVGLGSTFEPESMLVLPAGGFITAPANHPRYVQTRGRTVVQVHATGPLALTYVNPEHAPRVARHPARRRAR
jgi:hypothetical protein